MPQYECDMRLIFRSCWFGGHVAVGEQCAQYKRGLDSGESLVPDWFLEVVVAFQDKARALQQGLETRP